MTSEWVAIPDAENLTDAQLEAASDAAGAMSVRPPGGRCLQSEQPARVPLRDDRLVERRRRRGQRTRTALLLRLNPGNPLQPATLTIVYNADTIVAAGGDIAISPDNVDTSNQHLMINEDGTTESRAVMAAKGRDGSIWRFDLTKGPVQAVGVDASTATRVAQLDPPGRDGVPVGPGVWETSGIIDASALFGADTWLSDVQAHPPTTAPRRHSQSRTASRSSWHRPHSPPGARVPPGDRSGYSGARVRPYPARCTWPTPRPVRGDQDRETPGEGRRDRQADLTTQPAPQLHHRRARRSNPVARDVQDAASHADPRTTMRYEPRPPQPRPTRHIHRVHVRRRRHPIRDALRHLGPVRATIPSGGPTHHPSTRPSGQTGHSIAGGASGTGQSPLTRATIDSTRGQVMLDRAACYTACGLRLRGCLHPGSAVMWHASRRARPAVPYEIRA